MRKNKLNNKKITIDGIEFDSKREGKRYCELKLLLKAGEISNLELQKRYELIPPYYETIEIGGVYKKGPRKGQPKTKDFCVERSLSYIADFVYEENGETIVEDSKGYKNPSSATYAQFVIKRKLMLYKFGIRIKEV